MNADNEIKQIKDLMHLPAKEYLLGKQGFSFAGDHAHLDEDAAFAEWLKERRPQRILELGTGNGNFFSVMIRALALDGEMVSVDINQGRCAPHLSALARGSQVVTCIQGDSRLDEIHDKALGLLSGAPDFVFVDTDHTTETTRREVELYWPCVAAGGAMGFHDICSHMDSVRLVWQELCKGNESLTFHEDGGYGIGVVEKRGA